MSGERWDENAQLQDPPDALLLDMYARHVRSYGIDHRISLDIADELLRRMSLAKNREADLLDLLAHCRESITTLHGRPIDDDCPTCDLLARIEEAIQ